MVASAVRPAQDFFDLGWLTLCSMQCTSIYSKRRERVLCVGELVVLVSPPALAHAFVVIDCFRPIARARKAGRSGGVLPNAVRRGGRGCAHRVSCGRVLRRG